ncbi:transcription factor WRKY19-like isoform X2 [Triticum urartu]|uniref:transcription factor WRKY19-like isoform X2 n=1 Tax=Triticum urartu TaxID=4572 RepID=UPI0020439269|nr:transcription factor WRKY19-like isoform X2 [Triticum urartu]
MEAVHEGNGGGSGLVVTELSHIKELVKQLDVHLGGSPDLCKLLAQQIFAVTERSIGMIRSGHFNGPKRSAAGAGLDSPPLSATPSPLSGVSNTPFKLNKKRKTSEKGGRQIRVSSAGEGADAPVDDGRSWRKYGQKEILGAQHPRAYYRCTYQKTQGCAATKQVQRADDDPALFDVIYHGEHTCVHKTAAAAAGMVQPAGKNPDAESLLQSLSSNLTVKTEGLTAAGAQGWSATTPFSFSSPAVSGMTPPEQQHHPFSTPSTPENCFVSMPTSLEPSPATSGSNHMCMTPFHAQSELQTMVSALVEATSMPPADTEEAAFSYWGFDDSALDVNILDEDVDNFDISAFFA